MLTYLTTILSRWTGLGFTAPPAQPLPLPRPSLASLAADPTHLPSFVQDCPVALKYLDLLSPLDWAHFPERPDNRAWPGPQPQPRAPFVAAFLVKLNEGHSYMSNLRTYLVDHPALVWLLGFPLKADPEARYGFDVEASVPSRKQLGRILRQLNNDALQFLFDATVSLIRAKLPPEVQLGDQVSLDTKHIIAWVAENNPKAYIKESERLDKTRQPKGDADCKLGCKKKSNQHRSGQQQPASAQATPEPETATPADQQQNKRITQFSADQYFWGYNSGLVATKVPGYGEFVLAELTQTFDADDLTFFFPLLAQVERRLHRQPRFGALDAGFDAWYVFHYFHEAGGFAAVPFAERGGHPQRQFDPDGLPLCQASLAMPLKSTFISRKGLVPQQVGNYGCPLLFPEPTGQTCPLDHKNWPTGGCLSRCGTAAGARLRHQLDRHAPAYKAVFKQRTATERINSQAVALGIERPKLRNQQAIANQNTLIYVLINLRAFHRLPERQT